MPSFQSNFNESEVRNIRAVARRIAGLLTFIIVGFMLSSSGFAADGLLQIEVAGEAWNGPPRFRLWAGDEVIAEAEVSTAVLPQSNLAPQRSAIEANVQRLNFQVPELDKAPYVALEFINDDWAGNGKVGDRNLWVKSITVNTRRFSAAQLASNLPSGAQRQADFVVLYTDQLLVLDKPKGGWAEIRPAPTHDFEIRRNTSVANSSVLPAVDIIDTALIKIRRYTFDLKQLLPTTQRSNAISVATLGDRIMLAIGGQFYAVDLINGEAELSKLQLALELNEQSFLAEAAGKGDLGTAYMRVLDLAIIERGTKLAASFTKWDLQQKCTSVYFAVTDLPQDWATIASGKWDVVFQSKPCMPIRQDGGKVIAGHQAGGRIVETRPGILLMTTGDFEHDGVTVATEYPQDEGVDYGKIFEIDLNSRTATQFSIGHRNPQGIFQDRKGRIWETEHGPQGGDELNLILRGKDYGWPSVTLGTNYGTRSWPLAKRVGDHEDFEWPAYAWVPSLGISNLIEVRDFAPEWNGDLLVGSLNGQQLRHLRLHGDDIVYDEPIQIGSRLRDIAQLSDGRIVIATDSEKLIVLEFTNEKSALTDNRELIHSCNECHIMSGSVNNTDAGDKINLWGIYNRPIAQGNPSQYSLGLRSFTGRWDEQNLDRFLRAPVEMIPDTSMAYPGVKDDVQRKRLIDFLKKLN